MKCERCGQDLGRLERQVYIFFANKNPMYLCGDCGKELKCWLKGSCPIEYDSDKS